MKRFQYWIWSVPDTWPWSSWKCLRSPRRWSTSCWYFLPCISQKATVRLSSSHWSVWWLHIDLFLYRWVWDCVWAFQRRPFAWRGSCIPIHYRFKFPWCPAGMWTRRCFYIRREICRRVLHRSDVRAIGHRSHRFLFIFLCVGWEGWQICLSVWWSRWGWSWFLRFWRGCCWGRGWWRWRIGPFCRGLIGWCLGGSRRSCWKGIIIILFSWTSEVNNNYRLWLLTLQLGDLWKVMIENAYFDIWDTSLICRINP